MIAKSVWTTLIVYETNGCCNVFWPRWYINTFHVLDIRHTKFSTCSDHARNKESGGPKFGKPISRFCHHRTSADNLYYCFQCLAQSHRTLTWPLINHANQILLTSHGHVNWATLHPKNIPAEHSGSKCNNRATCNASRSVKRSPRCDDRITSNRYRSGNYILWNSGEGTPLTITPTSKHSSSPTGTALVHPSVKLWK